MNDAELRYQVGQLVLANWPEDGLKAVEEVVAERPLGGYVFHIRDIESPAWLRDVASQLWGLYTGHGWAPPWLAVTEEGGTVERFRRWFDHPSPLSLGETDDLALTRRTGALVGQFLLASGISWNFAPVGDVRTQARSHIIGTRAFAVQAERVAQHAVAWLQGHQAQGVLATIKHFPGHGMTERDSHVERPLVHIDPAELKAHLLPYRRAFAAGVAAVMTAHIVYPEYDEKPAPLSPYWLHQVLREELGFRGMVVTDALNMKGITHHAPPVEAAVQAITAGADVIDCGGTWAEALAIFDALLGWGRQPLTENPLAGLSERLIQAKGRLIPPEHWPEWPRPAALADVFQQIEAVTGTPDFPKLSDPVELWASGSAPTEVEERGMASADALWLDVRESGQWSAKFRQLAERQGPVVLYADNLWKYPGLAEIIRERVGDRLQAVMAVSDPIDEELFEVPCLKMYGNRGRARRVFAHRCGRRQAGD